MKIIVTGALGYIGSVLLPYLRSNGFECQGYDTGFFRDCLLYPAADGAITLRDTRDLVEEDFDGADVVVHLAGIANDPMGKMDIAKIYDPARADARRLAEICKKKGIRFIFASSCSVYGKSEEEYVNEDSQTFPQTPYSLNKIQIEEDLRSLSDKNFSPIALRLATIFGSSPRMRFDTVTNMFTGMAVTDGVLILNSDGKAWRPIVHMLDVCEAIRCAINYDYREGKLLILNVGDEGNNFQVAEIAQEVMKIVPGCKLRSLVTNSEYDVDDLVRDRKLKNGVDTRTYRVSFEKIRKELPGFKSEWPLGRGVTEMVEKFRALPLSLEMFKRTGFYRLQELEYLYEHKYLSDDLRWLKAR